MARNIKLRERGSQKKMGKISLREENLRKLFGREKKNKGARTRKKMKKVARTGY